MKDLTIFFDDLCHQGKTNINIWAQVSPQFKVIIQIWLYFELKHHPFKPIKLTKLTYVGHLSSYDSFRDFPIQFVDAMCSIGPYIRS